MNTTRKVPRLDPSGYDKDSKYNSRGYSRRSTSPDRDSGDRSRDYSKYNSHRQDSREYKYGRAKELRESDRDRYRDRSPRDRKNWDYKDKIRDKDVSERSNHSQSLTAYGDWSEQLSKSGKKYYYNRQTDASSWEKPREWVEAERSRQERSRDWCSDHDKLKSTPAKLHCDRNNRSSQDKHGGGDSHRSSPVSSSVSSRHRERQSSRVNNISSNHSESHNNYSRENSQRVSESSTGDATPTSEGEGDPNHPDLLATHPGGAVSLSAAISRISGPQTSLSVSTRDPGGGSRHSNQPSPHNPHYSQSPPTPGHDSLPSPLSVSRLPSLHPPPVQTSIQLTPSLNRLYKEQLIGHVLAWPAEHVERAINKVGEDANTISNHTITKVSADLKMARSLVRLAEIQATLQEQRILFLRQQMTDMERMETRWGARTHHQPQQPHNRDNNTDSTDGSSSDLSSTQDLATPDTSQPHSSLSSSDRTAM